MLLEPVLDGLADLGSETEGEEAGPKQKKDHGPEDDGAEIVFPGGVAAKESTEDDNDNTDARQGGDEQDEHPPEYRDVIVVAIFGHDAVRLMGFRRPRARRFSGPSRKASWP